MNGTCGCSPVCNDSRFLIFIVLFGKNKILSRKLLNFKNGNHILPNLKCAGVIHFIVDYLSKNRKNKKTIITKHLTSDSLWCLFNDLNYRYNTVWDTQFEKMNACITKIEDPLMENDYCHYSSNKTHLSVQCSHSFIITKVWIITWSCCRWTNPTSLNIQSFPMLSWLDCTVCCLLDLDLMSQSVEICLHLELIHLEDFQW